MVAAESARDLWADIGNFSLDWAAIFAIGSGFAAGPEDGRL
jgi:hypothetical protein